MQFQNLVGERFGRLVVVSMHGSDTHKAKWLCRCDCGKTKVVFGGNLRAGYTMSCGCFQIERAQQANIKHGGRYLPEYHVWSGMIDRCENINAPRYPYYGARGIKVCDRWKQFDNFFRDMGPRPSSKHRIERKDNEGNYEPGNCIWATHSVQMRNTRSSIRITIEGVTKGLKDWCEEFGQNYELARERIMRLHWPPEKALHSKPRPIKKRTE